MIEWQAIESAPVEKQILLWFPAASHEKYGKCRVGFRRNDTFMAYSAGGVLSFPGGPTHWAAISAPEAR